MEHGRVGGRGRSVARCGRKGTALWKEVVGGCGREQGLVLRRTWGAGQGQGAQREQGRGERAWMYASEQFWNPSILPGVIVTHEARPQLHHDCRL